MESMANGSDEQLAVTMSQKEPISPEHTVVFLHIPKAAGTTLHDVLERQYARDRIYNVIGPRDVRIDAFRALPVDERRRYRLIKGHMHFGLHELIPNPTTYITVLRDPVDRVLSHYFYVKRTPRHYLYKHVTEKSITLEEYVSSRMSLELNNGQVRALFGSGHVDVPYGTCTREMLIAANHNLQHHFSIVGIAERFDETLLLMKRAMGWKRPPVYVRKNVTKSRLRRTDVAASVIRRIEADNELDIELYDRARSAFGEDVDEMLADSPDELKRFLAWSRVYSRYLRPIDRAHTAMTMALASFRRRSSNHRSHA